MFVRIEPIQKLSGEIKLPLSKSICNRLQIINAISGFGAAIPMAESTDSTVLAAAFKDEGLVCNVGDAGTAFRFLTAYFAATPGTNKVLTGSPRLRERPIAELVNALQELGADISYADKQGYAPLIIKGKKLVGGTVTIDAGVSSQFTSALCMVAPTFDNGLELILNGNIVSTPYIDLTLGLMEECGVQSSFEGGAISIAKQAYTKVFTEVEADWSAASFYMSASLLCTTDITLLGLQEESLQGDQELTFILGLLGVHSSFSDLGFCITNSSSKAVSAFLLNMRDTPDAAIPLIVACAINQRGIKIMGLSTLIDKECNRIEALQMELNKIGLILKYENDILSFSGDLINPQHVEFDSHNDHRIAMALALVACAGYTVTISNAECVSKSYGNYWDDLSVLGAVITKS
jgi:3-phosphoshikimate 1-carboxyvinyltransferase